MAINVDALVDIEYSRDIAELKADFVAVDVNDPASLLTWFNRHPYLTVHDMARIGDVCLKTVYMWRKRAGWVPPASAPTGCRQHKTIVPPRPEPRRATTPIAPPDWTTDWLVAMYDDGYSIPQLARAVRRSEMAVKLRLKRRRRLRANKDSVRSQHRCCTLAWVFDHYVRQKLSQKDCAKLAGVSRYTFSVWLNFFKIRVRSSVEQSIVKHGTDLGKLTVPTPKGDRPRR